MPSERPVQQPLTSLDLAGQTTIDDVLTEPYDLTLRLPLCWSDFEGTAPSGR